MLAIAFMATVLAAPASDGETVNGSMRPDGVTVTISSNRSRRSPAKPATSRPSLAVQPDAPELTKRGSIITSMPSQDSPRRTRTIVFVPQRPLLSRDGPGVWETAVPGFIPDPAAPAGPVQAAPAAPGAPAQAAPPQPVLTEAMIVQAFHTTPFAKPVAEVQPVGGRTLVTLPTYVQIAWDPAGFEPGEISTVGLLGHAVRIRPVGRSYVYDFGDGGAVGPTSSMGGPYPTGDVTYPYPKPGRFAINVTATYSGEYSVDGGPWTAIADTVQIPGPDQPIDVRTSRNELIDQG